MLAHISIHDNFGCFFFFVKGVLFKLMALGISFMDLKLVQVSKLEYKCCKII